MCVHFTIHIDTSITEEMMQTRDHITFAHPAVWRHWGQTDQCPKSQTWVGWLGFHIKSQLHMPALPSSIKSTLTCTTTKIFNDTCVGNNPTTVVYSFEVRSGSGTCVSCLRIQVVSLHVNQNGCTSDKRYYRRSNWSTPNSCCHDSTWRVVSRMTMCAVQKWIYTFSQFQNILNMQL